MRFIKGKRAIVTGASKGIGFAIAQELCRAEANVLICARDQKGLDAAVSSIHSNGSGGKIFGTAADVGGYSDVVRLFKSADELLGGLDILVNNAGFGVFRPTSEMGVADWDRLIATNLSGAFYCAKEAVPRFHQAGSGHVINISSLAGKYAFAGGVAYNASKFGMTGFSEAMMLDHRSEKIRVSYIMPGSVDTEFGGHAGGASWKIAPEDIAEIVLAILNMPERTLISRVEVRPSLPKKD